jgi:hypothetical protein
MNKRFVAASILAAGLFVLPLSALEIKSGFFAGMGFAQWTGVDAKVLDDKTQALSNFTGGQVLLTGFPRRSDITGCVRFEVEFNNWLAFISDISFIKMGTRMQGTAQNIGSAGDTAVNSIEVMRRLNYLTVPVLVSFKPHFGKISPMVYVGPSFGFNCFAENVNKVTGGNGSTSDIKYLTYGAENHDLVLFEGGVCGGAGISYELFGYDWTLDARYSQGITSIIKGKKINNTAIAIMFGIMIPR